MNISIVLVKADGSSKEFKVPTLPARIGRGEDVRIKLPLSSVSRKHCELFEDDEELMIRDLGSSNGTLINGKRITDETDLVPGDVITIGDAVFLVRIDQHPQVFNPAEAHMMGSPSPAAKQPAAKKEAASDNPAPPKADPDSAAGKLGSLMDGDPDDSNFDFDFDLD